MRYEVTKYLAGDMKFLAIMFGINAANSKYPCVWCKEFNAQSQVDPNAKFKIIRQATFKFFPRNKYIIYNLTIFFYLELFKMLC